MESWLIPQGDIDERPIQEVQPQDLEGYTQAHFFAGIGGWPLALLLAGIKDDFPLWTGSCPCQSFSVAQQGRQKGFDEGARPEVEDHYLWTPLVDGRDLPGVDLKHERSRQLVDPLTVGSLRGYAEGLALAILVEPDVPGAVLQ
jgi:hypothetical protein